MEHWQLKQLQGLPLQVKINKTNQRIIEWYEQHDGNVYVSFSGGKDSLVLLHLVRSIYPDVKAVFVNTGMEYPEIVQFVKTINNVEYLHPTDRNNKRITFKYVLEKYGFPFPSKEQAQFISQYINAKSQKTKDTRMFGNKSGNGKISNKWMYLLESPFKVSDKCCDIMKKNPAKKFEKQTGLKPFVGIMADESSKRVQDYLKFGCNAFDAKRPISRPIGFWKEQDILEYIVENKLDYASVYGNIYYNQEQNKYIMTGLQRTGCSFCLFGIHLEDEPNRIQKMKTTHPKLYKYGIEKLRLGDFLDFINIKY
jgi:3'-phosphoadenosine 5'-phosphosulfate sulfotransferase (PAPS reductase)/FAD synthetase